MFAGPNGSGKSTLRSSLPKELLGVYLNPDEIEQEIRRQGFLDFAVYGVTTAADEVLPFFKRSSLLITAGFGDATEQLGFTNGRLDFGKVAVNSYFASVTRDFLQKKLMDRKASFTFETVMSHPSKVDLLARAQRAGYRTYLYFVATDDPDINISRVRNRVKMGGHAVPEDRIVKRYYRSLDLLMQAIQHTNRAYVFDNSGDNKDEKHTWLAEITEGRVLDLKSDQIPAWFKRSVLDKTNLPTVSVIIAARPDLAEVRAVAPALALDYPPDKMEIIVARGKQPSVQRNAAVRAAKGEIIFFLDDDSMPLPENLRRAAAQFTSEEVKMVGGPSICPPEAPKLEQAFALTMGAWLAFGPSCARYRKVGQPRASSEKELILCNLLARREALLALGGFNEKLYPNEENALMDELQRRGGKLLYDPELIVHRRPRPTFHAFVRMLLNYGRGRAEQFRLHPTFRSAPNFVPPLFCLYLALLPFLPRSCAWGLAAYGAAVLAQSLAVAPWRKLHWFAPIAGLIFVSHIFYGLGFWRGCLTRPKPPPAAVTSEVKLEWLRSFP
jgi:predicted ABC-type ATPase